MTTYLIAASATKADCLLAGLITGCSPGLARHLQAWEQHVADSLRMTEAAVTPLPGRRLASVPPQRDGSAS